MHILMLSLFWHIDFNSKGWLTSCVGSRENTRLQRAGPRLGTCHLEYRKSQFTSVYFGSKYYEAVGNVARCRLSSIESFINFFPWVCLLSIKPCIRLQSPPFDRSWSVRPLVTWAFICIHAVECWTCSSNTLVSRFTKESVSADKTLKYAVHWYSRVKLKKHVRVCACV